MTISYFKTTDWLTGTCTIVSIKPVLISGIEENFHITIFALSMIIG